MPDRDPECLGGTYDQLTSAGCTAYRAAKASGDSDFYYNGQTFAEPGKPNALLTSAGKNIQSGARAAVRSYYWFASDFAAEDPPRNDPRLTGSSALLSSECPYPTAADRPPGRKTDQNDAAWLAQLLGDRRIDVITRRSPLQARILAAFGVDTSDWDRAHISCALKGP